MNPNVNATFPGPLGTSYSREHDVILLAGYHVLFHCPTYEFLRTVYISNKDIGLPNEYNFIKYLQAEDQKTLIDLANFMSSMFKTRHQKFEMRMS